MKLPWKKNLNTWSLGSQSTIKHFKKTKGNNIHSLIQSIPMKEKLLRIFGHIVRIIAMDLIKYGILRLCLQGRTRKQAWCHYENLSSRDLLIWRSCWFYIVTETWLKKKTKFVTRKELVHTMEPKKKIQSL